jgi:hypothetical protein
MEEMEKWGKKYIWNPIPGKEYPLNYWSNEFRGYKETGAMHHHTINGQMIFYKIQGDQLIKYHSLSGIVQWIGEDDTPSWPTVRAECDGEIKDENEKKRLLKRLNELKHNYELEHLVRS